MTAQEEVEGFDAFYTAYPRHVGRRAAAKAFKAAAKRAKIDQIMKGLEGYKAYWEARQTKKEYIPHPSTWLNQDRWDDELDVPPPSDRHRRLDAELDALTEKNDG